jgi:hypothetical protein
MELLKSNLEPLRACCGLAIPFLRHLLECPYNDEDCGLQFIFMARGATSSDILLLYHYQHCGISQRCTSCQVYLTERVSWVCINSYSHFVRCGRFRSHLQANYSPTLLPRLLLSYVGYL